MEGYFFMIDHLINLNGLHLSLRRHIIKDVLVDIGVGLGLEDTLAVKYTGTDDEKDLIILKDLNKDAKPLTVMVDAEFKYNENHLIGGHLDIHRFEHIFKDKEIDVTLACIYTLMTTNLSLKFVFNSKTEALYLLSRIRMYLGLNTRGMIHDVKYSFNLPREVKEFITHIHSLKTNTPPLKDYLISNLHPRVVSKHNLDASSAILSIEEIQTSVLGIFSHYEVPDKLSKEEDQVKHLLELEYKFSYNEPLGIMFKYPLLIHNQLIDPIYRPQYLPYAYQMDNYLDKVHGDLDRFSSIRKEIGYNKGVPIPLIDKWLPEYTLPQYAGMLRILIQVDPCDPNLILDLKDLGEFSLDPSIFQYLQRAKKDVFKNNIGIIFLGLYIKDELVNETYDLRLTEDMKVYSKKPLNPLNYHHLWMGINLDLKSLSEYNLRILTEVGEFALYLLKIAGGNLEIPRKQR